MKLKLETNLPQIYPIFKFRLLKCPLNVRIDCSLFYQLKSFPKVIFDARDSSIILCRGLLIVQVPYREPISLTVPYRE